MNRILLGAAVITLSACSFISKKDSTPPSIYEFSDEITEEGLRADLSVIAHDSLQGRETGTEGLKKAARYLAGKYEEAGLIPVGDNDTYFQQVDFVQPSVERYEFTVKSDDGSVVERSVLSRESLGSFVPVFGGTDAVEGEIIFAGKGTVDEEAGINHYPENFDGKWIMILADDDRVNRGILRSILQSDAAGIITIVADTNAFTEQLNYAQSRINRAGRLILAYQYEEDDEASPAYNMVSPDMAVTLLGLEDISGLEELSNKIDEDPATFEPLETGFVLEHTPTVNENTVSSKNVVAFLEGSDPELKDEVVVLSSHYDHVGVGRPDSTGDAIYNGADDDGSGTVATLHTALAMAKAKEAGAGPRRSVLFLHVTAEEKGLLGSRYYSDHPIFPIEKTVANINIDMIGRVDPEHVADSNYVYIIGGEIISSGLDSLTTVANEMGPNLDLSKRYNDLEDPQQFYRRSDHWNFGRLGVPFVFFFNGVHPDYHRPSDHVDKITFGPYALRTRLVYNLTAILATADERPVVDNQEFIEKTQVQPR